MYNGICTDPLNVLLIILLHDLFIVISHLRVVFQIVDFIVIFPLAPFCLGLIIAIQ